MRILAILGVLLLAGCDGDADNKPDSDEPIACGNSTIDDGEACDDGDDNGAGPGHCLADCSAIEAVPPDVCGDGVKGDSEGCDDGDTIDNGEGGCLADCSAIQICGDDVTNGTEVCDDGDAIDNGEGGCIADCSAIQICGDTVPNGTEACDDGDTINNGEGGCIADCSALQICGDTVPNGTEACDDGDTIDNGDGSCLGDCSGLQVCGDGIPEGTEVCDDGYTDACGSCNADCSATGSGSTCGDTEHCPETEPCDDGTLNSDTIPNRCRTDCTPAGCGDDVIDLNEECDDGDQVSGNGCDDQCLVESGDTCDDAFDLNLLGDTGGNVFVWTGDTRWFVDDYQLQCADTSPRNDGVAVFVAPVAGDWTFLVEPLPDATASTDGWDAVIELYTGWGSCGALTNGTYATCADANGQGPYQESVTVTLALNEEVWLVIDGYDTFLPLCNCGPFTLTVSQ